MSDRPFICSKCGNWYLKIQMPANTMCRACSEGKHARNAAGIIDCHWGETSPTPSEIKMATLLASCQKARDTAVNALATIRESKDLDAVKVSLSSVEQTFAKAELLQSEIPEILRWAVVLELPGMQAEPMTARFKHIDAVRELVGSSRRPPEDLAMLERSDNLCHEIAAEVPALLAEARIALGQARQEAMNWKLAAAQTDVPVSVKRRTPAQLANQERFRKAAEERRKQKETVAV